MQTSSRSLNPATPAGIIPAMVTPYDADGRVDPAMAGRLSDHLISQGVAGLYLGGSTGEGPLQSPAERAELAATVTKTVDGRVPVIVHVGTPDTDSAIELAHRVADSGAQAVSAVVPYYYRHSADQVRRHFLEIADAAQVPFLPYYLAATAGDLDGFTLLLELAEHPNVVGMKYTSRDMFGLQRLVASTDEKIAVYNGADEVCMHGLLAGATGAIGSTYNFMPGLFVRITELVATGDAHAAAELQAQANAVIAASAGINSVTFTREILHVQGLDVGPARRPLQELDATGKAAIAELVERTEFLRMR